MYHFHGDQRRKLRLKGLKQALQVMIQWHFSIHGNQCFHEGLSAGLFQRSGKGLQPVHYISQSMTSAEKKGIAKQREMR